MIMIVVKTTLMCSVEMIDTVFLFYSVPCNFKFFFKILSKTFGFPVPVFHGFVELPDLTAF